MAAERKPVIGVLGAGAMGSGIAQVAATHGHSVVLGDAQPGACDAARDRIAQALSRDVEKERVTRHNADAALSRLRLTHIAAAASYDAFADCDLVVEAIVERLDAKREAFQALERFVPRDCALASNTSSLSIAAIGAACQHPERT